MVSENGGTIYTNELFRRGATKYGVTRLNSHFFLRFDLTRRMCTIGVGGFRAASRNGQCNFDGVV